MDVMQLKTYIYEESYVDKILQAIGCHHIQYHTSGYWSCANKDGDNKQAIIIYNNEWLPCTNYTRQMLAVNTKYTKQSALIDRKTDLLDLVCFNNNCTFPEGLSFICELLNIDYYHDFNADIPASLQITELIMKMKTNVSYDIDTPLKPISSKILTYYHDCVNDMFLHDNISYDTQKEFHIGYDPETNRITIPIYSEIGDLVGVKGRLFKNKLNKDDLKYIYLEPCQRSKIIYGLDKTTQYIKRAGCIYIPEAEKGTLQLWSYGDRNVGSTGGKKISDQQIELLTRLGVDIILVMDKDVKKEEIEEIANRFDERIPIYYIYDTENILEETESPTDNPKKWIYLKTHNLYRIK